MNIKIEHTKNNATPITVKALSELTASGGGELHFEAGEYHFYREGAAMAFFAVSNNTANDKYMAFPIINTKNITVDGHGSVFIFHEILFPFMISHCRIPPSGGTNTSPPFITLCGQYITKMWLKYTQFVNFFRSPSPPPQGE